MACSKQEIVQIVNDGFRKNNPGIFLAYCADSIRWTMLGGFVAEGKEAIRQFFHDMSDPAGTAEADIRLELTIVEGDKVASTGTMSMTEKDGQKGEWAFCDIYHFNGDLISAMNSYLVNLKPGNEKP